MWRKVEPDVDRAHASLRACTNMRTPAAGGRGGWGGGSQARCWAMMRLHLASRAALMGRPLAGIAFLRKSTIAWQAVQAQARIGC
jgi:hypothetical protein